MALVVATTLFCVLTAPFFSSNTTLVAYFFGKLIWDTSAGLVAVALIVICPGYIFRSVADSYDNAGVAIFALLLTFYLFIKAINTGSLAWALGSALGYFYMVSALGARLVWGAHGCHGHLLLDAGVGGVALGVGTASGYISPWTRWFYSLLDPTYAKDHIPIIVSVSEHQPTAWSSFMFDFHILLFFFPVSLYFCFKRLSDATIFVVMYGLTSMYFAGVMVRLILVATPAVCLISAINVSATIKNLTQLARAKDKIAHFQHVSTDEIAHFHVLGLSHREGPLDSGPKSSTRVFDLAAQISADLSPFSEPPALVDVANNTFLFLADLAHQIPIFVTVDFIRAKSHGSGTLSSGSPMISFDLKLKRWISTFLEHGTVDDLLVLSLTYGGEMIFDLESMRKIISGFVEKEKSVVVCNTDDFREVCLVAMTRTTLSETVVPVDASLDVVDFMGDTTQPDIPLNASLDVINDASPIDAHTDIPTEISLVFPLVSPNDEKHAKGAQQWQNAITGVGQISSSVHEFRESLRKYAIARQFAFRYKKNDSHRVTVKCKAEGCPWRIHASRLSTTPPACSGRTNSSSIMFSKATVGCSDVETSHSTCPRLSTTCHVPS
ncbi:hypothetical protein FF1_037271 [Malus domestica]